MNRYLSCTLILAALVCCIILPASAVIQEVTLKGSVASLNTSANMVAIENPLRYGCSYPASGSPVCTYTPMNTSALTETAPDPAAFTLFKTGDPVVATSLGGAGETWIALAKLFGSRPSEEYVTDIVGDASTIPTPLAGNYSLLLVTNPDCTTCAGTVCTAASASVGISSDGRLVANKTLLPGGVLTFNGRNDGSSVSVTFVNGKALPYSCPQHRAGIVGGVQPVSDYIVRVVPPIGMTAGNAQTLPPETSDPPSAATTPAQTRKSASLPVAVIGAFGVAALVLAARRL